MKILHPALKETLNSSSLTIAWCWLITRIDGVQLGFTSLDYPFQIDGVHYLPFTGFDPGAAQQSLDSGTVDSQQLKGILDGSGISATDLAAKIYNYGAVRRFLINYEDIPTSLSLNPPKHLELPPGHLAESKRNSLGYDIKVKDDLELLNNQIVDETSKRCRASLGDDLCRKDLTNFTYNLEVSAVESKRVFSVTGNLPDKWFDSGRLQFSTGKNRDLHLDIFYHFDDQIILFTPAPFDIAVGDSMLAYAGCIGTKFVCITKFQNFNNFVGEPDVPTTDLSIETPAK